MTFLKVATPCMDEEQHEADVQYLARDGLISVVDIDRLNFPPFDGPFAPRSHATK
jgi:hypothetical protein